jgi:hypothetical protein
MEVKAFTSNNPNSNDKTLSRIASAKNCMIKCFLSLPITFLTPTSFALLAEAPIANVVKLIQANQ